MCYINKCFILFKFLWNCLNLNSMQAVECPCLVNDVQGHDSNLSLGNFLAGKCLFSLGPSVMDVVIPLRAQQ